MIEHAKARLSRRGRVATVVLMAGMLAISAGTASATLPSGATTVTVSSGSVHSGVDGHLATAASISGKVTAVTGGAALSTGVTAYRNGHYVATTYTDGSGNYTIGGLPAGTYAVCVSAFYVSGGSSTTGYLGRCYKTANWYGGALPSGATLVTVSAGQHVGSINIALQTAAAIAGTVTSAGGTALSGVTVRAANRSSGLNYYGFSNSKGKYTVTGLPPSAKGYSVCFSPYGIAQGTTGFRPRCYHNVAWNGSSAPPSSATAVSVSLGNTHSGVSNALTAGGAIAGTVKNAANGNPLVHETVIVYASGGAILGGASTNSNGQYKVKGLAAATGDKVCVAPNPVTATTTFHGKCWKNVAWKGGSLPTGTTGVSVKIGATHSGISFAVGKTVISLGSIAGTITEKAGGQPLTGASVTVYSGGVSAGYDTTDSSGHYKVSNLRASSTGYVVCVSANYVYQPSPPATGWAPRCYPDVAWNGLAPPSSATKIPLSAGQNVTGKNIAVRVGGAIAGTTWLGAGSTTPATYVQVEVFTPGGKYVTSASSSYSDGTYSIMSLSPQNYIVCFDGRNDFAYPYGYRPQCYDQVAWTP